MVELSQAAKAHCVAYEIPIDRVLEAYNERSDMRLGDTIITIMIHSRKFVPGNANIGTEHHYFWVNGTNENHVIDLPKQSRNYIAVSSPFKEDIDIIKF